MEGDGLYGLPLERFVPERDALAKSLRAEGRREDAAQVAKLRKPSVAAWAVNQLVRTQGRAVAELFEAGDELASAHEAVVSGQGDGRSLRDAAARVRGGVDALVAAAHGLLTSDGHDLSPTIIDRVADTLHAAALDEEARAQVREGRLERELRHVGLGAGGVGAAAPSPVRPPPAQAAPPERRREPSTARKTAREPSAVRKAAREAEADARARAERAQRALRAASQSRDHAMEEFRRLQQSLAEAEHALAEAEEALDAARAHARDTAEEHRQATDNVKRLRGQ